MVILLKARPPESTLTYENLGFDIEEGEGESMENGGDFDDFDMDEDDYIATRFLHLCF